MDTTKDKLPETEKDIDIIAIARYLWSKRKLLLKSSAIAVLVALIVAFSIPKEYTTTVKLMPETNNPANKMGNLGGLAAIAGVDLGSGTNQDAISPELYPDVVHSTPFLLELFPGQVTNKKKTISVSLFNYLNEYQREAWWSYIIKAPLKGLSYLIGLLGEQDEKSDKVDPFFLTKEQKAIIKELQNRISVFVDKKTQVVTVSVDMQDPVISAQVTENVVGKLQTYITNYRTQKAKQDLEFTDKVLKEAQAAYYKAQKAYAAFEDGNKNIISASYRTEQERLRNEMTLTFNVYNTLAQKLEQDKLRVQEQTPVYTIIEPATVPLKASAPKKMLILVGFIFITLAGMTGYLLIRDKQLF
ncbi:Wzz/FepE/Etk N-terminal domain-containing protein [Parabacteroides gordonii]|jgi:uncharacterized protein involved in exopolysaccharide biosynthesis|uniref:Wzz/FepE/Etk N-terminal domain-containing protein n=1 Tax=Parabacteroides gordonii TaxID=574930 RepID=UPI002420004A|nr:Wzz/FepE/Etk N-terminal domain-containing protein [Parabacteroides gordonii]